VRGGAALPPNGCEQPRVRKVAQQVSCQFPISSRSFHGLRRSLGTRVTRFGDTLSLVASSGGVKGYTTGRGVAPRVKGYTTGRSPLAAATPIRYTPVGGEGA